MKMKKNKMLMLLSWICLTLIIIGCSINESALSKDVSPDEKHPTISFYAGTASGGIVDNTEMILIDGVSDLDAITGATRKMYNAGIHSEIDIKGHKIETGLDCISFDQSINYNIPSYSVNGKRDIRFHQLRLPLTYNLYFFRNNHNYPRLILKAGLSAGYTFSKSIADSGNIPECDFTDFDYGVTAGISTYPIQLKQNYRIGLYLDLYRGSQIYEDIYHKAEGMGGHSFMKFGVTMQPLSLKY